MVVSLPLAVELAASRLRFHLLARLNMRTAIYVRLQDPKHRMIVEYAKAHDFTINEVIERLVDQLLLQVEPRFGPPPWLVQAIRAGLLPHVLPADFDDAQDEEEDERSSSRINLRAL